MARLRAFLSGFATHLLVPDEVGSAKLLASGYGGAAMSTTTGSTYGTSATASDKSFALAYLPTPRTDVVVNLGALAGANVRLSWWNPGTAAATTVGTFAGTGTRALPWPAGHADAVLVVERAAPAAPGSLLRAINLNGPSLVIGGRTWESGLNAPNPSLTGTPLANQNVSLLSPPSDPNVAQMVRSPVYATQAAVRPSNVPAGSYDVYVHVWEDNNTQTYDVRAEGVLVLDNHVSGPAGTWARPGPWAVNVTDGTLDLTTSGGNANLSGIEVYRR